MRVLEQLTDFTIDNATEAQKEDALRFFKHYINQHCAIVSDNGDKIEEGLIDEVIDKDNIVVKSLDNKLEWRTDIYHLKLVMPQHLVVILIKDDSL